MQNDSSSELMIRKVTGGAVIPLLMEVTTLITKYKGRGRSTFPLPFLTKSCSMVFLRRIFSFPIPFQKLLIYTL